MTACEPYLNYNIFLFFLTQYINDTDPSFENDVKANENKIMGMMMAAFGSVWGCVKVRIILN